MGNFFLQALATLRQKLRKYNKDFEEDILKYREVSLNFLKTLIFFRVIHVGSIRAEKNFFRYPAFFYPLKKT